MQRMRVNLERDRWEKKRNQQMGKIETDRDGEEGGEGEKKKTGKV